MPKRENQKLKTLYVAQYFLENSDTNHSVNASDIKDYLENERGNKAIRIDNLINLCKILDISTDYILTGKETVSDIQYMTSRIELLSDKDRKMIGLLIDYCVSED